MVVGNEGEAGDAMAGEPIERASLCLPDITRGVVSHQGEDGFGGILKQYYNTPENDALERLVLLKKRLRDANTHDFWTALLREVCDIGHAQCGFVAKPADPDPSSAAVGIPLLGDPGSDILGVGFYLNSGGDVDQMHHNYRYHVQGTSCIHMQNDKVFLIPERLTDFVKDGWDKMPWENSEAYLGIPISHGGSPVAHFAMVWTAEGAAKRKLSWAFLEMFMHGLEDMILERLLEDKGAAKEAKRKLQASTRIVPIDAITASQTLKPYARSLSHELRSPMQGVVGMLDMMYSTVVDAIASQMYPKAAAVFEELKANMETAQDSSKRAVEAVDNVVHAYDLNMQMPETPLDNSDSELANAPIFAPLADPFRPDIVIEGSGIPLVAATNKRQRDDEVGFHPGPPMKRLPSITEGGLRKVYDDCSSPTTSVVAEADETSTVDLDTTERHHFSQSPSPSFPLASPDEVMRTPAVSPPPLFNKNLTSDRRQISTRSFIRNLVDQAIRSMRPVDKVRVPHNMGELIYVKTEGPRGDIDELTINVIVSPETPERIITKELHLTFAVMKVVDNAIKFTPNGEITIHMRLSRNRQLVEISVLDTGCGISQESKEHLFKPHFQEDATISRSRDGLGLSLFNAKAHVRRSLRGEMTLERSAISGPNKGSEFLIRFPLEVHRDRASSLPPKTPAQLIASPSISPRASPLLQSLSTNGYASYPSPGLPTRLFTPIPPPALVTRPAMKKSSFDRDLASRIPLTFLVAEDNAVNRSILVGFLKKLGYAAASISIAFDGAEAVEQYAASLAEGGVQIDAVLMDLWMPNVDGYEATERILEMAAARKREGDGEGPVVFAVSADITSDSLARAKGAGMRGFVSKPYRVMDIQKLIVEHFGDREAS
ncbi:hypothetical protein V499_09187 [Pseudogymnoascus sp. VKM F-103]|nr:hypothetical protein V499_09187 [Pseudogymnoascus sp. VKM F-103]